MQTSEENKHKCQPGDYQLIQDQILQTNITRIVQQTVRRSTIEILGVTGLIKACILQFFPVNCIRRFSKPALILIIFIFLCPASLIKITNHKELLRDNYNNLTAVRNLQVTSPQNIHRLSSKQVMRTLKLIKYMQLL